MEMGMGRGGLPSPAVWLGLRRYPSLWLSTSILLDFHLLVSTAAALQGKPPNATNTMLPDSVIAFMVFFQQGKWCAEGKG